jgi:hypothetical protein
MRTQNQIAEDYKTFRGKCKKMSEDACKADSSLTLVRGTYFCPLWSSDEFHWWTTRPDGSIYDPSARQFPSNGNGIYTPFDGNVECSECKKIMKENEASFDGRYSFCSYECHGRFIGIF